MTMIEQANTLTNAAGMTPFEAIAVRREKGSGKWCAMNRMERGFYGFCFAYGTMGEVLSCLNVTVTAVKCDQHSVYLLCEPGKRR